MNNNMQKDLWTYSTSTFCTSCRYKFRGQITDSSVLTGFTKQVRDLVSVSWPRGSYLHQEYLALFLATRLVIKLSGISKIFPRLNLFCIFLGWLKAVQVVISLGFICNSLGFISILLYACAQLCHQRRGALIFYLVNNYLGGKM